MAKHIQRSLITNELIVTQYLRRPYPIHDNSSLNQLFEIEQNAEFSDGEYPYINALVIGIKGHVTTTRSSGGSYPSSRRHNAEDTTLREHIPFVLRLLNDDLNEEQRKNYGLRKLMDIDGETYVAYYALDLDLSGVNIVKKQLKMRDGKIESETAFNFSSENQTPSIPEDTLDLQDALRNGDSIRTSGMTSIVLDSFHLTEIINVFKILFNDDEGALISEVGYCTSVKRLITAPGANGETISFNEMIGCQIGTFVAQFHKIESKDDVIDLSMDFGATATRATYSE